MTRILIATPTSGQVHTPFFLSMLKLTEAMAARGLPYEFKTYAFSDIVMSRNYLVSYFLSQDRFTHMFKLDSDMSFEPEQFFRLLDFDEDFVAAPYSQRALKLDRYAAAVLENDKLPKEKRKTPEQLLSLSLRYNFSGHLDAKTKLKREMRGDFSTMVSVGTGFMLFKRTVPERMVAEGHAHPLTRTGKLSDFSDAPRFADFFSHLSDPDHTALYGEDQSFCYRWVKGCGGKLWIDTKAKLVHHGSFDYVGDLSQF